ncbi:MAG: glycerate kinase [Pseudomonadota bacterium]|nr:glycerate kinase [Pseudomonadota bacterium]
MRVVIAPDSFKECLTAEQVAEAIACGWRRGAPGDEVVLVPLADGGEGTTTALTEARQGSLQEVSVTGPLGTPVTARFGLVDGGSIAIVEVAEGSGLHCVPENQRDALRASSRGTGELMLAALGRRPRTLIMGLGGSATTDGGAGILQALGAKLLDADGNDIPPGGAGLAKLASLDLQPAINQLAGVELVVACDVNNPLTGDRGAAAVFGPQKGASPEQVALLDKNLEHFARLAKAAGFTIDGFAGSGAAGGIGGTVAGILGATLKPGIELVMETVQLEQQVRNADLVITAEGAIDTQSAYGKTPAGVAGLASKHRVPVIGLGGKVGGDLSDLHAQGLTAAFSITPAPIALADAYDQAAENLADSSEQIARLVHGLAMKD